MRVEPPPIQKRNRPHWIGVYSMQDIAIFVQGEGRPTISLTQVKQDATIEELAVPAIAQAAYHAADGHECLVSLEETDEPLTPGVILTKRALKALSPSDALAIVDNLVAQILNARDHPLYALVVHRLQ
jgi:hypothetical protein